MTDISTKRPVDKRIVYENPWIKVHEDKTIDLNGNQGVYGYLESRDSVMVVVLNERDEIYLLRNFRYPSKSFGWELPGGGADNEEPINASRRELEEETGIIADSWETLGQAYVCNGLMTEKMSVLLARDLRFDGIKEDSDEVFSGAKFFSLEDIEKMIDDGEINDCQTLSGLMYYYRYRRKNEL